MMNFQSLMLTIDLSICYVIFWQAIVRIFQIRNQFQRRLNSLCRIQNQQSLEASWQKQVDIQGLLQIIVYAL